jgi:hypothetical protein
MKRQTWIQVALAAASNPARSAADVIAVADAVADAYLERFGAELQREADEFRQLELGGVGPMFGQPGYGPVKAIRRRIVEPPTHLRPVGQGTPTGEPCGDCGDASGEGTEGA